MYFINKTKKVENILWVEISLWRKRSDLRRKGSCGIQRQFIRRVRVCVRENLINRKDKQYANLRNL